MYFDGLQLHKEIFGNTYTYDDKGNVKSVKDLQKKVTTYEYDTSNNLTKILENNAAKMTYTYDGYHNVKTATSQEGVKYAFEYDTYGNNTKVSITDGTNTISASAAYTSNGNLLASTTDALDKTTTYSYNVNTGVLHSVRYPKDTTETQTVYSYDNLYRTSWAMCTTDTGDTMSASYGYTDDNLTSVITPTTTYSFSYGNFSLRSSVKIGSRTLASYSYTSGNNRLNKLTYGNGDYIQYTYDAQGRVTKQTYEDGTTVEYQYDRNGRLARTVDSASGISTAYLYDSSGRLTSCRDTGQRHDIYYYYDTNNNITRVKEVTSSGSKATTYTYDDDNRVISMTADGITVEYSYDSLGRLTKQVTKNGSTVISTKNTTYATSPSGKATAQVRSYNGFTYTYDDNGNIISVTDGTNTTSYVYDSQNQLIRENNQALGKTWRYNYDDGGNLISRLGYDYTTGDVGSVTAPDLFSYTDSEWGDLLTAYKAVFAYDEIGNILSDGTWTYTWKHGRQLASMTKGTTTWTYTYDANGMRTGRTCSNGYPYKYTYNGSLLTKLDAGGNILYFTYDANGVPLTISYGNEIYYYVTNLQGDVIGIKNSAGTQVTTYTYDAWGKVYSSSSSPIVMYNPLTYRGYVYDRETGLYYLQSRYYNPEWGRFISADDIAYLGADGSLTSYNLFTYCKNNPVMGYDPTGHWDWSWEDQAALGTTVLIVGLAFLLAAPTGGSSLAFGALARSSTTVVAAGGTMAVAGSVMVGDALVQANVNFSKQSKKTGKERATDKPSWVSQNDVDLNKSSQQNATDLLNNKYGIRNWGKGPRSEFNQIVKWIDRGLKVIAFMMVDRLMEDIR